MKKNKMMRIASVLLVAVLLSTCAIGGTFAKYTSASTGTASAVVAAWSFDVDGTNIVESNTFTFDLFDTVYDTNGGAAETDVADGMIAPGTKGSFSFNIKNTSDVTATYEIVLDTTALSPITFTARTSMTGELAADGTATVTVDWEWPFDQSDDAADAADMALAGATCEITATITATQKD